MSLLASNLDKNSLLNLQKRKVTKTLQNGRFQKISKNNMYTKISIVGQKMTIFGKISDFEF